MRLIELFDSREKKKRLSHIRNLIMLSLSDGAITRDELNLIHRIAMTSGLTVDEYQRILNRPDSVSFVPPESFRERIEQIYDLVLVMMVDGEFHEREFSLCKLIAIRLGFKPQIIDKMVMDVINSIKKGLAFEIAMTMLTETLED